MADFNHGIATVIKEIKTPDGLIQPGSIGQITAYLPEEDKFGVYFPFPLTPQARAWFDETAQPNLEDYPVRGLWITFDKYSLDQYCEIELSDDYKNK